MKRSRSQSSSPPEAFPLANLEDELREWTANEALRAWITSNLQRLRPARVHLVDGSDAEAAELNDVLVRTGVFIKLNEQLRPNSYLARSDVGDVARVEEQTFICCANKIDAGPLNNWVAPEQMRAQLEKRFDGCMQGRTCYVLAFSMGPVGSQLSAIGVQITDSPYVVVNTRIMTRMGAPALAALGARGAFVRCVHSVGAPLASATMQDSTWPCASRVEDKIIAHFPETREIMSIGSGYGGNALLGKKCFALRIASVMGRDEGWLAEHMLILGLTPPGGSARDKRYIAAAFPSQCGKTNLAMMQPALPGWKLETVGDDIAWLRFGKDGRLYAINPEAGFFGVATGTSQVTNPHAIASMTANSIFTNVALTREGDVWWEGMTPEKPAHLVSWLRREDASEAGVPVAHPNSRFTAPARQCPVIDAAWERVEGVPIDAIVFGGRRADTMPLVYEALDWAHGTYVGATMTSETTSAAAGKAGVLRNDPFAMRPFCGYNVGDYFGHWLSMATRVPNAVMPKIFHVNWFRKDAAGHFMWPGFGDNVRVLAWIVARCNGDGDAATTPIGHVPTRSALDTSGLTLTPAQLDALLGVDAGEWVEEARRQAAFLESLGERVPAAMHAQAAALLARAQSAADTATISD